MSKKVLMVIANNGFQDYEYEKPRLALEDAGFEIVVAARLAGECIGKFGLEVIADKSVTEVNGGDYDAVVFIGGPGAKAEFFENEDYLRLVRGAKLIGAICIAPMLISASGVVAGKRLASWNDSENESRYYIEKHGGYFVEESVVVDDGKLITANGPDSAEEFGQILVRELLAR